jgi:hypothetical protein
MRLVAARVVPVLQRDRAFASAPVNGTDREAGAAMPGASGIFAPA